MREGNQPDAQDPTRVAWIRRQWHSLDNAYRLRDRQIEENVRMLAGQHYTVYSHLMGKFIDALELLPDSERRWRQRPVFNRLLYWFVLTHSRLTENPPILSFLPGTGDRLDAELAEVMDPIFKSLWHDTDMLECLDRICAWLVPGGRVHWKSRIDLGRGPLREWRDDAVLKLLGPDGNPIMGEGGPIEALARGVPYGRDGNPLARLHDDMSWEPTGDPFREHEGGLAVDVLSALEVRGEWGPTPWHRKRWHIHRAFMTPEEVWDRYGLEVKPDIVGADADGVGAMHRLLTGAGYYGASSAWSESQLTQTFGEFVSVYELWHAPCDFPGMAAGHDEPGGRMMTVCNDQVAIDRTRPADFKHTSPIRCLDFINLPGRPSGTSPQEALNPIQRSYNRMYGAIMEHVALCTNPKALIDSRSGIEEGQWTNEPGLALIVQKIPGVQMVEYVAPNPLGPDVYKLHEMLASELSEMGFFEGADGRTPTADPSGELIEQLRFNSDRFLGATARRFPVEIARMAYDWMALLKVLWSREKVITWAGEDQVVRTITVWPHLFQQGNVNVVPDVESMLPESRNARQARIERMYDKGILGMPGSPEAISHYLNQARFPHLDRKVRPGGADRITAEFLLGKLVQGAPAATIPWFPWYDPMVHQLVLEEFMKGPDYLKLPPEIQAELFARWQRVSTAAQDAAQAAIAQELEVEAQRAAVGGGGSARPRLAPGGEKPAPSSSKTERPFDSPSARSA